MSSIPQLRGTLRPRRFVTEIACDEATIRETQLLRYRVFAEEMGAHLHTRIAGLDYDEFDDHCDHLLVRDTQSGRIVACTRLLGDHQAARAGGFYSEQEFDLGGVLGLPGRFLEIGRTCVDPDQRGSVLISTLWSGLAEYVHVHGYDYLMGCASITPGPHGFAVDAIYRQIGTEHIDGPEFGVRSRKPVPAHHRCQRDESGIPPLLQAYLRLGCRVLGDPYWDEDFNCMDVFILLDLARLQNRYERRFILGKTMESHAQVAPLV